MREILFRGKNKVDGEWSIGSLAHDTKYGNCFIEVCVHQGICEEVIPETVGQYTGLTDKNGNKIFEGDIIHGFGGNFAVRWSPEICSFVAGEGRRIRPAMTYGTMKSFEVIGNIYDNPELMEVTK